MSIGSFGTVLGFYVRLSEERRRDGGFAVHALEAESGDDRTVTLATSVDGGKAPYTFYVKVLDGKGAPTDHTTFVSSPSGALARSLNFADLVENGAAEVTFAMHAENANNIKSATATTTARIGKAAMNRREAQTVRAAQPP